MARRVLIVGAGVTGLLSAIACALAGYRVTVLDRGPIPNPASTSFDQHRALRALVPEDAAATRRAAAAHQRWLELRALLGTEIYRQVGVVTAWPEAQVGKVLAVAAEANVRASPVEPAQFPHVRFPSGSTGILEPDAGVLLADRILRAATRWLERHPTVTVAPGRQVTAVADDNVTLADGATLGADLILIAAGPWSRELLDLPMVLYRQAMVYLHVPDELAEWWHNVPSAGGIGTDGQAWLLPPGRGTLLKVSSQSLCRQVDAIDVASGIDWREHFDLASVLADADRYPIALVRECHYQVDAATGQGSLVRLSPTLWARAASGGDGFRTAPLIADQIAEQITSQITSQIADQIPAEAGTPKEQTP
jgi:glycine/D-amino acid oxidase-like deaminating enzyme